MKKNKYLKIILGIFLIITSFSSCDDEIIEDNADWSFVAIGDIRSGYGIYSKLVDVIGLFEPSPVFVVILGDIVSKPGNELEWLKFRELSAPVEDKTRLYTIIGNHDVDSVETEKIYKENVDMPGNECYYSFEENGFHFISLDTEIPGEINSIINDQYDWLENELDTASTDQGIRYIIIFLHRPLYPQGKYIGDNLANADQLQCLFESYPKTKLVIAGHEHQFLYLRKNGILHIISGGGGSPLYTENGGNYFHLLKIGIYEEEDRINIKTIGIFGETIENFNM